MDYMKERIDALHEIAREGWLVVYEAKEDLKGRVSGLNVVLGAEKALSAALGFIGITLKDVETQENLEKIKSEVAELKRLAGIAERNKIEN